MKVKELSKMLDDCPQEMEILVEASKGEYLHRRVQNIIIDIGHQAVYIKQTEND